MPKLTMCYARLKAILDRITLNPLSIDLGERNTFVLLIAEHISLIVGLPMIGVNMNVKSNFKSETFERLLCDGEYGEENGILCEKLFQLIAGEGEDATRDFFFVFHVVCL
ncbi:hypothetical protein Droror1_Dr00018864 [Drosera rotundifolia]